jgi:TP901 family phage tail tape measure protein
MGTFQNKIVTQLDFVTGSQVGLKELETLLNRLKTEAQALSTSFGGNAMEEGFQQAIVAAEKLQQIVTQSTNVKLGKIDLSEVTSQINKTYGSMEKLQQQLHAGGAHGDRIFNSFNNSLLKTNLQLKESNRLIDEMATSFGNTVKWGISSSVFNTLTGSLSKAWDYAKHLDSSLNDIRIVTGKSADEMERFAKIANNSAKSLGASTLDYTEAALIYYQQGDSDEVARAKADVTLKTANVTGQSGQEVSEQLTAVWNGYKVSAEEAELYIDKLAAVAASTASDLEELSTGMSKVASAASIMGVDIDQLNATLATVVSVTRQAPESVGTAFKTIYARMGDIEAGLDAETTLGSYTEKIKEIAGINVLDANGQLRDMGEVIEEVGNQWGSLSREQQIALSQTMAGTRQYNNLLALFDNWDMYTDALNTSAKAAGTLQKQQDIYMESTAAHLQELETEWERLYDEVFDQKTANGFIDILTLGLTTIGDYIEGLGGGLNALINMGAGVGQIFSKNIAKTITTRQSNKQTQKDNEQQMKDYLKNTEVNLKSENLSEGENAIEEQNLERARQLLEISKYLTSEEFQQLNTQRDEIRALELKIQKTKELKEAGSTASLEKSKAAQSKKEASYILDQIKEVEYAWEGLQKASALPPEKQDLEEISKYAAEIQKISNMFSQNDDEDNIYGGGLDWEGSLKEQGQLLKELNISTTSLQMGGDARQVTEEQINALLTAQKTALQNIETEERERLQNAQLLEDAENNIYETQLKQAEQEAKNFDKQIKLKNQEQNNQQLVENAMLLIQGATALIGGLGVLADEESTGAEKANASWSMLSTTASAVGTLIGGPVVGMITSGVLGIAKAGLEATGVWEDIEDLFKSTQEKLDEVNKEVQEFNEEIAKGKSEHKANKDSIKELEEMQDRFEYLQKLAQKGLLTEQQQTEYENYLSTIKSYNEDIVVTYTAQGNMITSNNNALQQTIDKLKEINEMKLSEVYTDDSWDETTEALEEQHKQEIQQNKEDQKEYQAKADAYGDPYHSNNDGDFTNSYFGDLTSLPGYEDINGYLKKKNKTDALTFEGTIPGINPAMTLDQLYQWNDVTNQTYLHDQLDTFKYNIDQLAQTYPEIADELQQYYEDVYNQYIEDVYDDEDGSKIGWGYGPIKKKYDAMQEKAVEEFKKPNAVVDYDLILNTLKYNTLDKGKYDKLKELGVSNLDGLLDSYLQGLDFSSKNFTTDGHIDYDKIKNHLLTMEKDLAAIFANSPDLLSSVNKIRNKDRTGLSSTDYEKQQIEEIKKFLEGLSQDEFEAIESYLPALFGVESVSAQWDAKQGKATLGKNGGNIVTSGEQQARTIGKTLSESYVGKEDQKKGFAEGIEQYLQENLDEVELSNLDTEKFSTDFNNLLFNALNDDGTFKKGMSLEKVLNQAIANQSGVEDAKLTEALYKHSDTIEKEGLDAEDYKQYTKHIMEMADESDILADSLEDDAVAAAAVAKSTMRMNKGVETLAENFEEWNDVLRNSDESSEEYCEALNDMRDAVADLLDVEEDAIDSDFLTNLNNLRLIEQAAKGNADAIEKLRDAYADEILLDIAADNLLEDSEIQSLKDKLNGLQNEMPDFDVGRINDEEFIKSCEQLIADAGMTAEQANKMFAAMNIEPEYETTEDTVEVKKPITRTITINNSKMSQLPDGTEVPITDTSTYSYIDGYVPIKETILKVAMGVNGKSPKIKGLTKKATGAMNNSSSINKGGKSGGGSKPQKVEKTKNEKDRYHDVNVKLKQISNSLDEVQQQTDLLTGQDYINNLADQYGLLNKEIEKTAEKIEIAKDEQAELQAQLAGNGVTFNSDGTIANYASAYDAQLAKLHAVEDRYNSMNADQQEKYQETYDKAKEDWDAFLETISRYDELVTEEIPELEDAIREANLKQIELKVDAFNYEIDLRLNMSELERDWNAFYNKVIKDIDEDDILGNAMAKLEDFTTYYKDNAEGVIQVNSQHVLDLIDQLEQMKNGTASIYGEDGTNNQKLALEELQKYYEQLMEDLEAVHDLTDEIRESYVDMLDEAQEKFDEQIETFETINNLIEHDKNVISMIYGEESYSTLSQFYDKQEENYNKQLDFQKQQIEFWKQQMATAEEGSDAWNAAKENWISAVDAWNSAIETAIQNLQDKYLNAINAIFQNLNNNVTGGMGLGYVETEWDLINTNADQYLDTVNAIYKVQELQNKYLDAIEKSSNPAQQKKLNDLMQQETDYLREQDKLSEYDLERANLKYEIALKQMALEDAQQNKSKLRLRRDSQGNYTYQYTQDEDQIASIQSEIADLYNQLYNLDADAYKGNLEEIFGIWKEFQEKMAEAAQINDPEQRAAKELLIKEQYSDLINGLVEKNENLQANMYQSTMSHLFDLYNQNTANYDDMSEEQKSILDQFINTETDLSNAAFDNLFDLYNINIESFKNMTAEQQDTLMNSMVPQWNSGVQQMIDKITAEGGFLPTCKNAFEELDQATEDYMTGIEELQNQADVSFDDIKNGIDEAITATEELLADNNELIDSYDKEVAAIKGVLEQLDGLIAKYEAASNAAKKATEDAKNYWLAEQNKNADVDSNIENIAAEKEKNQPTPTAETPKPAENKPAAPSLNYGSYISVKPGTRWYADSYGGGNSGTARAGNISYINPGAPYAYNIGGLGWVKKSDIVGYDTGGYTGDWTSKDGRLAMLHQKELVLNAHDTDNMLSAITILRDLTANLSATLLNRMASITSGSVNGIGQGMGTSGLEQSVVINAEFPNATSSKEIEDALNNLVNRASQHITK